MKDKANVNIKFTELKSLSWAEMVSMIVLFAAFSLVFAEYELETNCGANLSHLTLTTQVTVAALAGLPLSTAATENWGNKSSIDNN